jgi:hypothetical protein
MNLFTAELGEPMTSDVEMQRPNDLQAMMSLARAFERRASMASLANAFVSTRVPYRARPTGSTATSMPATPTNSSKSRFHCMPLQVSPVLIQCNSRLILQARNFVLSWIQAPLIHSSTML